MIHNNSTALLSFLLLVITAPLALSNAVNNDDVILIQESDPEMNQAIAEAKSTLDTFLNKYMKNIPNVPSYTLKVMLTDKNGVEHFWVKPFRPSKNGGFEGILANEPQITTSFKLGQLVSFSKDMITDWGYQENGKQYGSYTVCVLLKHMPKEEATYYRKKSWISMLTYISNRYSA